MAHDAAEAGRSISYVPTEHGDAYSALSSYFLGHFDAGHAPYSLGYQERFRLGDVTATEYDRELYSPFFARYAADTAARAAPETELPIITKELEIVTAALRGIYTLRKEERSNFRRVQAELTNHAKTIQATSRIVNAAFEISTVLQKGDYEIAVIAHDIVTASGLAVKNNLLPYVAPANVSQLPTSIPNTQPIKAPARRTRNIA